MNSDDSQQGGISSTAFAPAELGDYFFIAVNARDPDDSFVTSRVVRYEFNEFGIIKSSRKVVLEVEQTTRFHHIGQILFSNDNYLLVGFGDGGITEDNPDQFGFGAQDLTDLRGSILRLDVSSLPYAIPSDNPFVGTEFKEEIFAYGFRNPWRFSMDSLTKDIWIGDVGQLSWEEINILESGANYGWPMYEGRAPNICPDNACSEAGLTFPVYAYSHDVGIAIIGGFVYRGTDIPELYGKYVFGDFVSDTLFGLDKDSSGKYEMKPIASANSGIASVSLAMGPDGEVYLLQRKNGIFKLQRRDDSQSSVLNELPDKLSETGCVNVHSPFTSLPDIVSYEVNSPLWSDGSEKYRHISVPDHQKITVGDDGQFNYPTGTTLIKTFSYDDVPHETRLMIKHAEGWAGYSYEWDWLNKEAILLEDTKKKQLSNGLAWTYPSRNNCFQCHTNVSGRVLGFESLQLNRSTDNSHNQLEWLESEGILEGIASIDLANNLSSLDDSSASYTDKFKSYVHSNCSYCHQPNGPTAALIDFRYTTPLSEMNICDVDTLNLIHSQPQAKKILSLNDYTASALYWRVNTIGTEKMPPIGTTLIDEGFKSLLEDWYAEGLAGCN